MIKINTTLILAFAFIVISNIETKAQSKIKTKATKLEAPIVLQETSDFAKKTIAGLKWRNIGPFRGGRSLAVAGHAKDPLTYYFGGTGAGIWKTTDGGANWDALISPVFQSSSVGAIAVAPSNKNVIYAGMGEADMRSNISFGDGMYKSPDAGKTWQKIGLPHAEAIANITIHPQNEDIVYVAAVGNPFAPNKERGVFRTKDGGKTWNHILAKNDSTGAYAISMDQNNPQVLYASMWQAFRNGHSMSSGGVHCGMFKSVDGGDNWVDISKNPGLPKGLLGKIGISVSPANSEIVYGLVENENGGLFRSDDAGETWKLVNNDKNIWQRPWYYMQLAADPQNADAVIVLNVNAFKSTDGGKTFAKINVGHGDTHDVWINPNNSNNFIIADDGGAEVTYNNGKTFSDLDIPTAQFYHVALDNEFPYHVYGAQQDNSSIKITSASNDYYIESQHFKPVAGGEAGYIVPSPNNHHITFGGEYDGQLTMFNEVTGQNKRISAYPETNIGTKGIDKKYRFQWTYPIVISPHNANKIYVTSNYVHVTQNNGQNWSIISPDLSTNNPITSGETGGPITKDMTGAEIYNCIFTFAESSLEKDQLWAGTDDGLLHLSKDGGNTWLNITPNESILPKGCLMSMIEPSKFKNGTAFLAANKYMYGDRKPYLLMTTDFGKTWQKIVNGIPADEYCRVLRENPNAQGMLFTGTERGIYVSLNNGQKWEKLNNNLPISPIRDLQIQAREHDLVVATHGRSFWIMDDLTALEQLMTIKKQEKAYLFASKPTYLMPGGQGAVSNSKGQNPANGLVVRYFLPENKIKEVKILFTNLQGDTLNSFTNLKRKSAKVKPVETKFYNNPKAKFVDQLNAQPGLNEFVWNLRLENVTEVEGTNIMWAGNGEGAKLIPGTYKMAMIIDSAKVSEQEFIVKADQRLKTSQADYEIAYNTMQSINKNLDNCHKTINKIRSLTKKLDQIETKGLSEISKKELIIKMDVLKKNFENIEAQLMQPKAKAPQDVLAYPVKLNDKLASLFSELDGSADKPTQALLDTFEDLKQRLKIQIDSFEKLQNTDLKVINELLVKNGLEALK